MDDRSQILRDVDDSDEEEDRQIEDMQGITMLRAIIE